MLKLGFRPWGGPILPDLFTECFRRKKVFLILLLMARFPHAGELPYRLEPKWDYPFLGAGLLAAGLVIADERSLSGHSIDPSAFNRGDIPGYDRWVIGYYSPRLSLASDVLIVAEGLTPLALTGLDYHNQDEKAMEVWRDLVLYGEVVAYASAFSIYAKTFLIHPRPLVFTENAPMSERTNGDSRSSFVSEHTTGAFAAAVFTGYTFGLRHPESTWVPWVWTGALGAAATEGVLRVASGKHFPSDVLAGAALGAFIGYAVPRMHRFSSLGTKVGRDGTMSSDLLSRMEFLLEPIPSGVSSVFEFRIN